MNKIQPIIHALVSGTLCICTDKRHSKSDFRIRGHWRRVSPSKCRRWFFHRDSTSLYTHAQAHACTVYLYEEVKSAVTESDSSKNEQFLAAIATNCRSITCHMNGSCVVGYERASSLFSVCRVYYVSISNILVWICGVVSIIMDYDLV
jgi:hypothetical protein